MKRLLLAGVVAFSANFAATAGHAQETVKIGIINPYSGSVCRYRHPIGQRH